MCVCGEASASSSCAPWVVAHREARSADRGHHPVFQGACERFNRIQLILRRKRRRCGSVAQGHAENPPVAAAGADRVFREDGLMRAVKCAQSQVYDADAEVLKIMVGPPHIGRQPRQRLQLEPGYHNR
jgi:hypothetical protein